MRLDEITYLTADRKKNNFHLIKSTRKDVSFAENDQYAILRLKRSKIDLDHSEMQIILIVINQKTCSMTFLRRLFLIDSQFSRASLFRIEIAFVLRV